MNFTVYNKTARTTVVPWRILGVNPPDLTFRGFYYKEGVRYIECGSDISATQLELDTTFVGRNKERMDLVDPDLIVLDIIATFGPYVKFLVEEIGGGEPLQLGQDDLVSAQGCYPQCELCKHKAPIKKREYCLYCLCWLLCQAQEVFT